jgi:hypothetical protein
VADSPLLSLARVNADVPAELAARIATAGRVPEAQLNYMVAEIDPAEHRFQWLVCPLPGNRAEYFQASRATGRLFELRSNSPTGLESVRG